MLELCEAMRGRARPPEAVKVVVEMLCILLGIKPVVKKVPVRRTALVPGVGGVSVVDGVSGGGGGGFCGGWWWWYWWWRLVVPVLLQPLPTALHAHCVSAQCY